MRTSRENSSSGGLALLVCASLSVAGCAGEGIIDSSGGGGGASCFTEPQFAFDPRLTCIQDMVFTPTCASSGGCHAGTGAVGLSLADGATHGETVGVPAAENISFIRVSPGDPNDSWVFMKIVGDARSGSRMPLGGQLTANEILVIRTWILRGALDD